MVDGDMPADQWVSATAKAAVARRNACYARKRVWRASPGAPFRAGLN
jgi:hypothetical protein